VLCAAAALYLSIALSPAAQAAPRISTISTATVSGDMRITLTGSGFRTGPTVVLYDTFSGGVDGQLVRNTATAGSWLRDTGPHFKSYLTDEMGFATNRVPYGSTYDDRLGQMVVALPNKTNTLFVSYSIYLPPGATYSGASSLQTFPSESSWKFLWAMDTEDGFGGDGHANIILPNSNGNGNFAVDGNAGDLLQSLPPSAYHNFPVSVSGLQDFRFYWSWDQPNNIAMYLKPSLTLPLVNAGEIYWRIANGKSKLIEQTVGVIAALPNTTGVYDIINIPGWWGNGDQTRFQAIYDNIYIAVGAVKARVELTDASTYANSTKVYPVPYVQWSDGTIVLSANQINLKSLTNYYVYVTDDTGARSTGLKVCNGCTVTTPNPPTNAATR